jgi:hypothetical protein
LLSPSERTLRAKLAAHTLHAHGGTSTIAGTTAFLAKFVREVDPDGVLPPEERARRARHARQAHMARLSLASCRARSRNAKAAPVIVTSEAAQEVRRASDERPSAAA